MSDCCSTCRRVHTLEEKVDDLHETVAVLSAGLRSLVLQMETESRLLAATRAQLGRAVYRICVLEQLFEIVDKREEAADASAVSTQSKTGRGTQGAE